MGQPSPLGLYMSLRLVKEALHLGSATHYLSIDAPLVVAMCLKMHPREAGQAETNDRPQPSLPFESITTLS